MPRTVEWEEWCKEATARFGPDPKGWRFVCPVCGHVASIAEWDARDGSDGAAFSCIGRWMPSSREAFGQGPGPCNYAGGGLVRLNPVTVVGRRENGSVEFEHRVFEFAPLEGVEDGKST